ncbi:hypothetical protein [Lunatibacter salilacus]|uniref:hypothetical protein n=1 Tax=Lunatibacter salilacus TaxID=2483804 RepID=UPI00131AB433|nr:hypothetical protein [Lunatibacter salilacus]
MLSKYSYCLLLFIFTLFAHQTMAQFTKGEVLLGGSFGFGVSRHSSSTFTNSQTNLSLQPQIGRFMSSRSAVGIMPTLYLSWYTPESPDSFRSSGGMGLFFRRYFKISDKVLAFVQPTATYLTGFGSEPGHNQFRISVNPGAAYRFNSRWMAELNLGGIAQEWRKDGIGMDNELTVNQFSFNILTNSNLGLFFIISAKKQ